MTNIFFVGDTRTPFIEQDFYLLSEDHKVKLFDLASHQSGILNIAEYCIDALLEWNALKQTDVVWIWFADYPALPFVIIAKLLGKPVVVNVGGWEVCGIKEIGYGNQLNIIRGAISRLILSTASMCVCMSPAYMEIIKNLVPSAEVLVIPGWVERALCSSQLPEKSGVVTATYTRDVDALKGIRTFELATTNMNAQIISGVSHESLLDAFKSAKVCCQLSYTESFAMSVLEAMACGCVPVVSDRDSLPELVGGYGFVVPYGDVDATRSAIALALRAMPADVASVRRRAGMFTKERKKFQIDMLLRSL